LAEASSFYSSSSKDTLELTEAEGQDGSLALMSGGVAKEKKRSRNAEGHGRPQTILSYIVEEMA
jgi:hypothetical protein